MEMFDKWKTQDAIETYGIRHWGKGYFGINSAGHVTVHPSKREDQAIDLKELVEPAFLLAQVHGKRADLVMRQFLHHVRRQDFRLDRDGRLLFEGQCDRAHSDASADLQGWTSGRAMRSISTG